MRLPAAPPCLRMASLGRRLRPVLGVPAPGMVYREIRQRAGLLPNETPGAGLDALAVVRCPPSF